VLICVARLGLSGRLLVYFCAVRVSPPGRLCWRASRPLPNPRGAHGNRASPKWVFVVRALVTVKGTGAAKDELNKM
jgi:hypothetical protein